MSIGSVSGDPNWWSWQNQAPSGTAASSNTTLSSTSISNAGSPAEQQNIGSFLGAFSADLQSMLTQLSNSTAAPASGGTTVPSDPTAQTASTQPQGGVHHHRHHHHTEGAGGDPMQTAANQPASEIGPFAQSGSASAGGIANAGSAFATGVFQALQAYGTAAPGGFNAIGAA